jgi:hypothetical protein
VREQQGIRCLGQAQWLVPTSSRPIYSSLVHLQKRLGEGERSMEMVYDERSGTYIVKQIRCTLGGGYEWSCLLTYEGGGGVVAH